MAAEVGASAQSCTLMSAGAPGSDLRQKALGDDVEDAGVGEVVEESCVEGALQGVGLRIGRGRFEVRDGDANVGDAGRGFGVEAFLRAKRHSAGQQQEKGCKTIALDVSNGGPTLLSMHSVSC